ncbi:transcription-repair coupling factor [bacterium]|nr:transcription-repair coupling factor [bacterium]
MLNIHCKKFDKLKNFVKKGKSFAVSGLTSVFRLILLNKINEYSDKKILFITSNEQSSLKLQADYKKLFGKETAFLPFQSISAYETVFSNKYEYSEQIKILRDKPNIVFTPIKTLLEKFPDEKFFIQNNIKIKINESIDTIKLAKKLVEFGYKRSVMVSDVGEFSVRGDIIDIYSLNKNPVRIELWGDDVVDIRYFNNETQKSISKIKEIEILPVYKFISSEKVKMPDEILNLVQEDNYFEGIEVYQSYFNENLVDIFDYFKDYLIIFEETGEIYSKYKFLEENYETQYAENLKLALNYELKDKNHIHFEDFIKRIASYQKIGMNNFIDSDMGEILEFDAQPAKNFNANLQLISEFIKEKRDYETIIATNYPERVKEILAEKEIFHCKYMDGITSFGTISDECKFLILTDRELFNKRSKEVTAQKKKYYKEQQEYIENINDIQPGEYVVHTIHGVGIYQGLTQQEIDGQLKDYLTIEYANKDKLHIPAEQINLLCRYRGSGSIKPKLSRMGGNDWESTKTKVKKAVESIAQDLLRLYAKRKMQTGIQFDKDTNWQIEMEEAFEYVETPDQMRAIEEVKHDMESESPMDRLICGDVGFGKTEVAMRAIFKAITSGKQVAVIVPTTILALQHYQTISERFKPFAMNVQLLCRFRSQKEQKETLKQMALGECDVVIGTHRLLQDGIQFKDLGLLVIDEEHRFGVRHKEKLKQLKENIDIISMSATPIPRTLYMSLSGIKDMSLINTPPKNRLPVKTFVGEFNETAVKNAIIHELDREGQVFYLYNRVETIEEFKLQLQRIVPNARIVVGHGKMNEHELEQVMLNFANYEYDILLSTTIIESGLDIPNANTIIIHDADKFGLAQLYQLRGRVGRCEKQAYCYCFYKKNKSITEEAIKRLKAIKEFTTLGSGYQIAMRDVEIRGVGNLLGTKQHGHMINVGFDTYCQLLDETIKELQGEKVENKIPAIVDINVTAYIPDEWVGSTEQKMIEYKRLADVKNQQELDYITEEWKDRFAKSPESVDNLIKLIKIRLGATEAGISLIRETSDGIRIYTPYTQPEWRIIYPKLKENVRKNVKFTQAPKTCKDGVSILLLNNKYINFDETFNILTDLFYYINKTKYEYSNKEI